MAYVDGFVLPVPKKNLAAYRKLSVKMGKITRALGALEYIECVADDVKMGKVRSRPSRAASKSRRARPLFFRGSFTNRANIAIRSTPSS